MAITHIATNEGTPTSANTATTTITKPSGLSVNDVMVAYLVSNKAGITAPSARWTRLITQDSASNQWRTEVWYCVATSSEVAASNFAFGNSGDSGAPFWGAIAAYRGVDTANPINASNKNFDSSPGSTHNTPTITTTAPAMILYSRAVRRASATITTFTSGIAHERFDGGNHGASTSYAAAMYDTGSEDSAGSVSAVTITSSTSSLSDSVTTTIALKTLNVAVNASAGVALVETTATPVTGSLTESPDAGSAATTGVAHSASVKIGAPAGTAATTATVQQVTVSSTPFNNVPAGRAQTTAVALQTRMNYAPAGSAAATVALDSPSESVGNRANTALGSARAYSPSVGFTVNAGIAHVAGSGVLAGPGLGSAIDIANPVTATAYKCILYFGSSRTINVGTEVRVVVVPWEERTLMVEES